MHDEGDDLDDLLHEADVVEDGEEGRDEDDGGQNGEGEDRDRRSGNAEIAEDERGAIDGVAEQAGDEVGDGLEHGLAIGPLDDGEGEDDLQAEAPDDGLPADGAPVGGEGVCQTEEGEQTEQTGEPCQDVRSEVRFGWRDCGMSVSVAVQNRKDGRGIVQRVTIFLGRRLWNGTLHVVVEYDWSSLLVPAVTALLAKSPTLRSAVHCFKGT